MAVNPIPEGFSTVTPHLVAKNTLKTIEFYKKALGAEQLFVFASPDGKVGHAEIKIGNSTLMLSDESPQTQCKSPETLNGSPVSFYLYVVDVDSFFKTAVNAGCKVIMPVTDMFWGDRIGTVEDPFGYRWSVATQKEKVAPEEIERRAREFHSKK